MDFPIRTAYAEGRFGGDAYKVEVDAEAQAAQVAALRDQILERDKLIADVSKAAREGATAYQSMQLKAQVERAKAATQVQKALRSGDKRFLEVSEGYQKLAELTSKGLDVKSDPTAMKVINERVVPQLEMFKGALQGDPESMATPEAAIEKADDIFADLKVQLAGADSMLSAAPNSAIAKAGAYGIVAAEIGTTMRALADAAPNEKVANALRERGAMYDQQITAMAGPEAALKDAVVKQVNQYKLDVVTNLERYLQGSGGGPVSPETKAMMAEMAKPIPPGGDPWLFAGKEGEPGAAGLIDGIRKQRDGIQADLEKVQSQEDEWDPQTKLIKTYEEKFPGFNTFVAAMGFPGDERASRLRALAFIGDNQEAAAAIARAAKVNPMIAQDVGVMREALKKQLGVRVSPGMRAVLKDVKRRHSDPQSVYDPQLAAPPRADAAEPERPRIGPPAPATDTVYQDGGGYSYKRNEDGTITMLTAPGKTGPVTVKPGDKGFDAMQKYMADIDSGAKKPPSGPTAAGPDPYWEKRKADAEAMRQKKLADLSRGTGPDPLGAWGYAAPSVEPAVPTAPPAQASTSSWWMGKPSVAPEPPPGGWPQAEQQWTDPRGKPVLIDGVWTYPRGG